MTVETRTLNGDETDRNRSDDSRPMTVDEFRRYARGALQWMRGFCAALEEGTGRRLHRKVDDLATLVNNLQPGTAVPDAGRAVPTDDDPGECLVMHEGPSPGRLVAAPHERPEVDKSHDWYTLPGMKNRRCRRCGAYANLSSGFVPCPKGPEIETQPVPPTTEPRDRHEIDTAMEDAARREARQLPADVSRPVGPSKETSFVDVPGARPSKDVVDTIKTACEPSPQETGPAAEREVRYGVKRTWRRVRHQGDPAREELLMEMAYWHGDEATALSRLSWHKSPPDVPPFRDRDAADRFVLGMSSSPRMTFEVYSASAPPLLS